MKTTGAGTVPGYIVWIIVFGIFSASLLRVAMVSGGITSAGSFAMQPLGRVLCTPKSTAMSCSYTTTITDENGNHAGTAYDLHCVDTNGTVVKEDPVLYTFLWIGIIVVIGLNIAALLAFALAAP